jgi:hypothetical protein
MPITEPLAANMISPIIFSSVAFPQYCSIPSTNMCAVLGIYEVYGSPDPSDNQVYGTNPQSFIQDSRLFSYINEAMANTDYAPRGAGQQPYVYKRNFA